MIISLLIPITYLQNNWNILSGKWFYLPQMQLHGFANYPNACMSYWTYVMTIYYPHSDHVTRSCDKVKKVSHSAWFTWSIFCVIFAWSWLIELDVITEGIFPRFVISCHIRFDMFVWRRWNWLCFDKLIYNRSTLLKQTNVDQFSLSCLLGGDLP